MVEYVESMAGAVHAMSGYAKAAFQPAVARHGLIGGRGKSSVSCEREHGVCLSLRIKKGKRRSEGTSIEHW